MSMSNSAENDLLELLFLNQDWEGIGDAGGLRGSVTAGNFYIALHTADPGEDGDQSTNEADYTGYSRVAVPRTSAYWEINNGVVSNKQTIQFNECTGGNNLVTHFSVGKGASGATQYIFRGALSAPRQITSGITPLFNPGQLSGTLD